MRAPPEVQLTDLLGIRYSAQAWKDDGLREFGGMALGWPAPAWQVMQGRTCLHALPENNNDQCVVWRSV